MELVDWVYETLFRTFAPEHLDVQDESRLHTGHAGAKAGGRHFRVLLVSEAFRGQDPVARQRSVYAALGDALRSEIHAITLRTLTPQEWHKERGGP